MREALRAVIGVPLAVEFELGELPDHDDVQPDAQVLSAEELIEHLKERFGAKEVFDD